MRKLLVILSIAVAVTVQVTVAQRRITPVNNAATMTQSINENKEKGDTIDKSKLVQYTDETGKVILVDTVTGKEFVDSAALPVVPKMIYPLFKDVTVGVDIWDPVMRLFGQSYGLIEFSGEVNLHNRYIPVVEVGLGTARNTPDDNNYTYRTPLTPYFRIGMNYNFLYNSNPDYMAYAGIRYGFTPFKYEVTDITLKDPYWGENVAFGIPSQNMTAGYLDLMFGIRVKIAGNISMGWAFKFHKLLHESDCQYGKPWYIPGFGSRGGAISGSFSVYYTLPLRKKQLPVVDNVLPVPAEPSDTVAAGNEASAAVGQVVELQ